MTDLRVLSVASEAFPLIKTGGLADVVGALPGVLAPLGVEVRTLVPGYPAVMEAVAGGEVVHRWRALFGGPASLVAAVAGSLDLLVLDAPHLFDRPGNPYVGADGKDWPDNAERFAALAFVGAEIGTGLIGGYAPDVIHAHDWQAALVPAYLRFGRPAKARANIPATILTVHNLAFQGQFPADVARETASDAAILHDGRRGILRPNRIPEGRPRARRSHHDRVAHLRRGDPGQRDGHGA